MAGFAPAGACTSASTRPPSSAAMPYLIFITFVWALSFNLIGEFIAGRVDSDFAVLTRVVLAGAAFLPFTRWRGVPAPLLWGTVAAGALQFGVTYLCLYRSYGYLTVPEVLLFTIFTPVYVTLLDDLLARRFNPWASLAALVAVGGALIIRYGGLSGHFLTGFFLLQLANLTFAAGQVGYRRVVARYPSPWPAYRTFGFFFLGALAVALPSFLIFGNPAKLPATGLQWGVLAFMGLGASALGFYFWNKGACQVDAGTLGIMNNMHIPAGLALSLLVWRHETDLGRLLAGGAVMGAALALNAWGRRRQAARLAAA